MTWDKLLLHKHGGESTRELHVLNVYGDPDFTHDLARVNEVGGELDKALLSGLRPADVPSTDDNIHTLHDVAARYYLTLEEVIHFSQGLRSMVPLPRNPSFRINWNEYDGVDYPQIERPDDKDYFSVRFHKDIKKEDFMQIWEVIKRKQASGRTDKKSRRRAVENDKLIYAIFKARIKNERFSNIFKSYEAGTLNGYTGSTDQFQTEESLERYYSKHKPRADKE